MKADSLILRALMGELVQLNKAELARVYTLVVRLKRRRTQEGRKP